MLKEVFLMSVSLKNSNQSVMLEGRLNYLCILSIENDILWFLPQKDNQRVWRQKKGKEIV